MDKIAIIDFGGQYAHLIGTRVRRMGVYSEIFSEDVDPKILKEYKGIILSGGPQSVYEEDSPKCDEEIFELGIPVLGICYGHQYMNYVLGGKVSPGETKEYGLANVKLSAKSPLFVELEKEKNEREFQMWMSHGDEVSELAPEFSQIGSTSDCVNAAAANEKKNLYGVQFHPEVTHSLQGNKVLENFVFNICKAGKSWEFDKAFVEEKIQKIRQNVGDKRVFLLISGGVDSTVAFALIAKAIGSEKVYGLFVDTGFMRKNEGLEVEKSLKGIGVNLHIKDASSLFFERLKGVSDPEKKRVIIGDTFLDVKDQVAAELNLLSGDWLLGQGTIYPDTIESGGTKRADKIKTHHNRVDKIIELKEKGLLIEPIADLYKDEVRKIGELLGLPKEMVWRHPFPGPALAVRCLCNSKNELDDEIKVLNKELADFTKDKDFVTFSRVLPVRSVGVQGDARTYKHAAIIGSNLGEFDEFWLNLGDLSSKITNKIKGFNRVLLSLNEKTIDLMEAREEKFLTPERITLLQEADFLTNQKLKDFGLYDKIWQFPVVLVPVSVNDIKGESIILRPVLSTEAMTAEFAKLPLNFLKDIAKSLLQINGISGVFYDITNKPPATIEWE